MVLFFFFFVFGWRWYINRSSEPLLWVTHFSLGMSHAYTRHVLYSVAQSRWLFATLCIVALQAPLSMGFYRQEYRNRLPFPPPGDLLDPGIKPMFPASPALQVDSLLLRHQGNSPYKECVCVSVAQSCPTLWDHGLQPARLLCMKFSRPEYWSGLPFSSPGIWGVLVSKPVCFSH